MIKLVIGERYKVSDTECILSSVKEFSEYLFKDGLDNTVEVYGYECTMRTDDDFRKVVDSEELKEIE